MKSGSCPALLFMPEIDFVSKIKKTYIIEETHSKIHFVNKLISGVNHYKNKFVKKN